MTWLRLVPEKPDKNVARVSLVHWDQGASMASILFIIFTKSISPQKKGPRSSLAEDLIVQELSIDKTYPEDALVFRNNDVTCTQKTNLVLSQLH
jgi:hypothetical protein